MHQLHTIYHHSQTHFILFDAMYKLNRTSINPKSFIIYLLLPMHYIRTDHTEQQKQLELDYNHKNNYYQLPNQHTYRITEMLTSISYEYFQNHLPTVVEKIKEMIVSSFSDTYSLDTFREIMALLKKQRNEMKLFKDYLIEMNTAFAESHNDIDLQNEPDEDLTDDSIFLQTLNGQSHLPHNLQQCQLPIFSQLQINCSCEQTKTQKTMQSDLCSSKVEQVTPIGLSLSGTAKLASFFSQETFNREEWKTERKKEEEVKESSGEMSSFHKRGSTILDSNKDLGRLLIKQLQYDISRQINLAKGDQQKRHIQLEKHNYQQKIKSTLVNYKLRMRKSK